MDRLSGNDDQPDEEIVDVGGVKVAGFSNLPARLPADSSSLYAKNLLSFLELLIKDGEISIDLEDEIINDSLVTHAGEIRHQGIHSQLQGADS